MLKAARGGIFLKLGFGRTAAQALCTVLALGVLLGLYRQGTAVQAFGAAQTVRLPILMYHSILKDSARQGGLCALA